MFQTTGRLVLCVLSLFILGIASAQHEDMSLNELLRLADQGDVEAQKALAARYVTEAEADNPLSRNYGKAMAWYLKAAEQGDAEAQFQAGRLYQTRDDGWQNYDKALKWYSAAAQQGHAKAQNNIGNLYTDGQGVPRNAVEAMKWYHKAAPSLPT